MNRSKAIWVAAAAIGLIAAAGCRQQVTRGNGNPPNTQATLNSVKPADIKANYEGMIELEGDNFSELSQVAVNGTFVADMAGVEQVFVSANKINLQLTQQGYVEAADWDIEVLNGATASETRTLHIRPVLTRLEYVRTLPEFFAPSGGKLELWVQPVDSEEIVMLPGHEVAGEEGFTIDNFEWSNIQLTHDGTGTQVTPSDDSIIRVIYGPRFTGDNLGFAVAIDNSGSMGNNDGDGIRFQATKLFVDRLTPNAQMMTIGFNDTPNVRIPFTNDKTTIKDDLDSFQGQGAGGGTALYDAIMLAMSGDNLGNGAMFASDDAKIVIALTDGQDSDSNASVQDVINRANQIGAIIFPIGLGDAGNLDFGDLISIAQGTGGTFFQAEDADALPQIFEQLGNYQADSYRVEAELNFNPPLTDMGKYLTSLDLNCLVDGEEADTAISDALIYVGQ